ncbi:MAG: HlyD family efflux transporter periplasmic adaptor subunit, partial [Bacteroidales bacterium]|nr:HlyD family efflux transporter periplasmic adaptor subunit [Bacteroidales bacterium]
MLNISKNSINQYIKFEDLESSKNLYFQGGKRPLNIILIIFIALLVLVIFLPWTQNIQTQGFVNARNPEQRPQAIQTVLGGKIESWHVKEGDRVEKGDTILEISEIKSEYFDTNLVQRTQEQIDAKTASLESYQMKIDALEKQFYSLETAKDLKQKQTKIKIKQVRNQIAIDSMNLTTIKNEYDIAINQQERLKELYNKGLKSLSELQEKQVKFQQMASKLVMQENKLLNEQNELTNYFIELSRIEQEYFDKMTKSQSERQSAISEQLNTEATIAKMRNELANYQIRKTQYFVLAPQDGFITHTLNQGIGEIIKEGAEVATISPLKSQLAVELYIKPQDLPLIENSQKVRMQFDGWPAFVISGWPEATTGV